MTATLKEFMKDHGLKKKDIYPSRKEFPFKKGDYIFFTRQPSDDWWAEKGAIVEVIGFFRVLSFLEGDPTGRWGAIGRLESLPHAAKKQRFLWTASDDFEDLKVLTPEEVALRRLRR